MDWLLQVNLRQPACAPGVSVTGPAGCAPIVEFDRSPPVSWRVVGAAKVCGFMLPVDCRPFGERTIRPAESERCEVGPVLRVAKRRSFATTFGNAARFTGRSTGCRLDFVGVTGSGPRIRLPCSSIDSFTG